MKKKETKVVSSVKAYKKPEVLAGTKHNKNFSSGCMGGNCCCLHCRQN